MKTESTICVYTDGGSRGNPGPSAIGVYITRSNGEVLFSVGREMGITTNNVAEYTAVLVALEWISSHKKELGHVAGIQFYADSELAISQLNGLYKVKSMHLKPLFDKIRLLASQLFIPVTYTHIPREKNKEADRLVNMALDKKI